MTKPVSEADADDYRQQEREEEEEARRERRLTLSLLEAFHGPREYVGCPRCDLTGRYGDCG